MYSRIFYLITILLANNIFSQTDTTFISLKGFEDYNENTYLVYETKQTTFNLDVDSTRLTYNVYDVLNDKTTLIDNGFNNIYYPENHIQYKHIDDIEFFNNDPKRYIYATNSLGIDPDSRVSRYDSSYTLGLLGFIDDIYISPKNSNNIYVVSHDWILRSFDGGFTWPMDSSLYLPNRFIQHLTFSPFDESIMFGYNGMNQLVQSIDTGKTFGEVLTVNHRNSEFKLFFDNNDRHIYVIVIQTRPDNPYYKDRSLLYVSDNKGIVDSWELKQTYYDSRVNICLDDSISGNLYLSNGDKIYKSNDFGSSFTEYIQIIHHANSLYKKPKEEIIFASVSDGIIKIQNDSISYVLKKSIKKSIKLFPLSVGNKWVYNKVGSYYDTSAHNVNEYYTEEITKSEYDIYNNNWFFVKVIPSRNDYWIRLDSTTGYIYIKNNLSDKYKNLITDLSSHCGNGIEIFNGRIYNVIEKDTLLWGSSRNCKIFDLGSVVVDVRTFAQGLGIIEIYSEFDFGQITTSLKSCIIENEIYGDTTLVSINKENIVAIPTELTLSQNYPNPFNPTTTIEFSIPFVDTRHELSVQLKIYDVLGREVTTLVNKQQKSGTYGVTFDASSFSSGIYYYQLKADDFVQTKKMILLR